MSNQNILPFGEEAEPESLIARLLQQHSKILNEIESIKSDKEVWLSLSVKMKKLITQSEKLSSQFVEDLHDIIDGTAIDQNILENILENKPQTTEMEFKEISKEISTLVQNISDNGTKTEKALISKITAYSS